MTQDDRPADEDAAALVGITLEGGYQVTRLLASGAMGTVYEATQIRLGKRVAIKVMDRKVAANAEGLARFRREIQVTAQLAHPNIIQVSDFGTAPNGAPYLVMEYLEGEDLDQRLQRVTRLPMSSAIHIVNQLASALAVTHAEGIVHRDLKPANVFLLKIPGQTDFVKVVDFGISKVLKASAAKLTNAQMIIGTPEYMAPEQAAGKVDEIDHRSDQWSLACIAWHMIVGQMPFVGPDVNAILQQVMNGEPPRLEPGLAGLLSPEVEAVLRRALSKRQQDRFPTITAFARIFEAAATPRGNATAGQTNTQAPADRASVDSQQSGRVWAAIGVGVASLVVVLAAVLLFHRGYFSSRTAPPTPHALPESGSHPTVVPMHAAKANGAKGSLQKHRPLAQAADELR